MKLKTMIVYLVIKINTLSNKMVITTVLTVIKTMFVMVMINLHVILAIKLKEIIANLALVLNIQSKSVVFINVLIVIQTMFVMEKNSIRVTKVIYQ